MSMRKTAFSLTAFAIVSLIPSIAQAAFTWTGVTPANNNNGSGSSQAIGAVVDWLSTDTAPTQNGVSVNVLGGYSGSTTVKYTTNSGVNKLSFLGTVSFSPALPQGLRTTFLRYLSQNLQ